MEKACLRTSRVDSTFIALLNPIVGPQILCSLKKKKNGLAAAEPAGPHVTPEIQWLSKYVLQDVLQMGDQQGSGGSARSVGGDSSPGGSQASPPRAEKANVLSESRHSNHSIKLVYFPEGLEMCVVYLLFRDTTNTAAEGGALMDPMAAQMMGMEAATKAYVISVQVPKKYVMRVRTTMPSISDKMFVLYQKILDHLTDAEAQQVAFRAEEFRDFVVPDLNALCEDVDRWIAAVVPSPQLVSPSIPTLFCEEYTQERVLFLPQVLQIVLAHHRCIIRGNDVHRVRVWLNTLCLFMPDHKLCFSSNDIRVVCPDLFIQGTTEEVTAHDLIGFRYPCCVIDVCALAEARHTFPAKNTVVQKYAECRMSLLISADVAPGGTPATSLYEMRKKLSVGLRRHVGSSSSGGGAGGASGGAGGAGASSGAASGGAGGSNNNRGVGSDSNTAGGGTKGGAGAGGGGAATTADQMAYLAMMGMGGGDHLAGVSAGGGIVGSGPIAAGAGGNGSAGALPSPDAPSRLVLSICQRLERAYQVHQGRIRSVSSLESTNGVQIIAATEQMQATLFTIIAQWRRELFMFSVQFCVKELASSASSSKGGGSGGSGGVVASLATASSRVHSADKAIFVAFFEAIHPVEGIISEKVQQILMHEFSAF